MPMSMTIIWPVAGSNKHKVAVAIAIECECGSCCELWK